MSVDILPSSTVRSFVVKECIHIKATWNFPDSQYLDRFAAYDDEEDFKEENRRINRSRYDYYDDDDDDEDEDEDMERPEPISWEQRMGDWKIVVEAEPYQRISFKANLTTWTETFGVGTYEFKVVGRSSSNRKKVVFTNSMETTIKTISDYKPHLSSSMDTDQIRNHLGREGEGSLKLEFLISFTPVNATSANYDISRVLEAQRVAFNDPATSDIAFKFPRRQQKGGHRYLYAKKSVLRQTSPYFESMFGSGFSESNLAHESRASETDSNSRNESFSEDSEDSEDSDCDTDEEDGIEEGAPKRGIPMIVVRDGEYKTYRALLFYAETGCVYLNPLTSEYDPPDPDNIVDEEWNDFIKRNRTIISTLKDHPPFECSPKSLYRLADKLQFDHLKAITYRHIMARLTPKNILDELFSSFTSFYDQIRIGELHFLKMRWSEVSKQTDIIDLYLAPVGKVYGPNSLKDIFEILQPSK